MIGDVQPPTFDPVVGGRYFLQEILAPPGNDDFIAARGELFCKGEPNTGGAPP